MLSKDSNWMKQNPLPSHLLSSPSCQGRRNCCNRAIALLTRTVCRRPLSTPHRHRAIRTRPGKGRSPPYCHPPHLRTSSLEGRGKAPSGARSFYGRALHELRREVDAMGRDPRRAISSEWRPGPHPTSRTRIPGVRPSCSTRKSISWVVPIVNEFRRYAGPRNSATLAGTTALATSCSQRPEARSVAPLGQPRPVGRASDAHNQ